MKRYLLLLVALIVIAPAVPQAAEPKGESKSRLTGSLLPHRHSGAGEPQKVIRSAKRPKKTAKAATGPSQRGRFTTDEVLENPGAYTAR